MDKIGDCCIRNELLKYSRKNEIKLKTVEQVLKEYGTETKKILTDREVEVLEQLATGISNKEIAQQLCISIATVKSHIINIYTKLQVNSRVSAVEAGKQMGIL